MADKRHPSLIGFNPTTHFSLVGCQEFVGTETDPFGYYHFSKLVGSMNIYTPVVSVILLSLANHCELTIELLSLWLS